MKVLSKTYKYHICLKTNIFCDQSAINYLCHVNMRKKVVSIFFCTIVRSVISSGYQPSFVIPFVIIGEALEVENLNT